MTLRYEITIISLRIHRTILNSCFQPQYYETISNHTDSSNANNNKSKSSDNITRIYACATMWHETEDEMMEMLKSIFRMDEDQCARRITQKYLEVVDPEYYEFESKKMG